MDKNILVLTGSPRKGGNSDMLADAFIAGAKASGHQVNKFSVAAKTIHGCRACDTCWTKGTACSFKDGFTELEPLLEAADIIVFATPLYWFGMSSQIKAAIDRLYAYNRPACLRPLKIRGTVLLICGADKGTQIFDGAIKTYKAIVDYLKWEDKGILAIPGVSDKGDIAHTDALTRAEKLGRSV